MTRTIFAATALLLTANCFGPPPARLVPSPTPAAPAVAVPVLPVPAAPALPAVPG